MALSYAVGRPSLFCQGSTPQKNCNCSCRCQRAEAKRVAAEAAPHLCDEFAIKPTTTKDGPFCALAAVMWGDETADLQKHCIEVLAPGYRTFLARRSAESGQK